MKVKLLTLDAKIPTRAESGSNGYDLYASEDIFIPLGKTAIIPTGISIEMHKHADFKTISPVFKIDLSFNLQLLEGFCLGLVLIRLLK